MNILQIKNGFRFKSYFMIVGAFIFLLASGCRKDEMKTETGGPNYPNPTATIESRFEGLINTQLGEPLAGATVLISGEQTVTDEEGFFRFAAVKIRESGSHVVIAKEGYIEGHKIVYPHKSSSSFLETSLVKKEDPKRFSSLDGGEISTDGEGIILFTPNGIRLESGGDYNGEVSVYTHWYSPTDPMTALTMPGNLEAMDESSRVQLETYGMMYVELRGESGQKLQLKEGSPAQIKFPSLESLDGVRDIIPLWSFDESNGLWVKEGEASLVNDHYEGEVNHFSFWNCDYPWSSVLVEGRLITNSGAAISNYPIHIYRDNNWLVGFGYTNTEGKFEGRVPQGVDLTLKVWHCGIELINTSLGSLNADTDLGDYQTDLTDFAFGVTGSALNCSGGPATDAYAIANRKLVTVNLDGTFSTVMTGCGNQSALLTLIDPVNLSVKSFNLPIDQGDQDLGPVTLCDLVGAYIVYSVDGEGPILATAPEAYYVDGEIEITNKGASSDNVYFTGSVSSQELGVQPIVSIYSSFNRTNDYIDFSCNDANPNGGVSEIPCTDLIWTTTVTGEIDDTLKGTFIGTAFSGGDTINGGNEAKMVDVIGSFSIPIVKKYQSATVNGTSWVDTNPNDIRDPDEDKFIATSFNLRKSNGDYVNAGWGGLDSEGNYTIYKIEPGEYYISTYIPNESSLVAKDAGADDVDSEFYMDANNQARTDLFTIGEGETLGGMDVGFTVPTFKSNGASIQGCIPEITLFFRTVGGVRPFSFELSDGQTNENGVFVVSTSELFTCTVTDALGRVVDQTTFPETHNNQIRGIVWEESNGGEADVYDANIDTKYDGAVVNLLDENGTFMKSTTSSWNGYGFTQVKPGKYIIEIEVPSGYDLVAEGVGMDEKIDSDINTSTMRSEVIEIIDCFEFIDIFAGLKKQ